MGWGQDGQITEAIHNLHTISVDGLCRFHLSSTSSFPFKCHMLHGCASLFCNWPGGMREVSAGSVARICLDVENPNVHLYSGQKGDSVVLACCCMS